MPAPTPPFFVITIDTEGDNLWALPKDIRTENAAYLPRFQELCERHGLAPCYLTNYEMALSPAFRELGRRIIAQGTGEVGMHLHAWHSPPEYALTEDDYKHCPYLIEYPEAVMREKIAFMTALLEDAFQTAIITHRAGRWSMNNAYARMLIENGYLIDCSVTPHVSWRGKPGDPAQQGGSDYSAFPDQAYLMDGRDISRPAPEGQGVLLELPVTIAPPVDWHLRLRDAVSAVPLARSAAWRLLRVRPEWLRPRPGNLRSMIRLLRRALKRGDLYVEFMLHSSEFMPGANPTFRDHAAIERLYADLERLFVFARRHFTGATPAQVQAYLAEHPSLVRRTS